MAGEVNCPQCKAIFKLDDFGYAEIIKQVRDESFEDEVENKVSLMKTSLQSNFDLSLERERAQAAKYSNEKDNVIETLKSDLRMGNLEKERSLNDAITPLREEILVLQGKADAFDKTKALAIRESSDELNIKINDLKAANQGLEDNHKLEIKILKNEHQGILEMRAALSTKMVGESLEVHCENEFNKIRATAFPQAEFNKDSTVVDGTKGDYIYRDFIGQVETISILFEMKNQVETTEQKTRNSHHFDRLDRNRKKKNCEYAVLVSLLETDSDYYNGGIVDVSHEYEKMFVVRPQFFIPLIGLLRNAALRSVDDRIALVHAQEQNIDVTNFVGKLEDFKGSFKRNFDIASRQFEEAIQQIDKSIKSLEKTKEQLLKSGNQLRIANGKADDITIRKLTRDNATVQRIFQDELDTENN